MAKSEWILNISSQTDGLRETHSLLCGQKVLIGRSRQCDIRLSASSISRKHCVFEVSSEGRLFISDLGSTFSTKLQGVKLSTGISSEVRSGDSILLGETVVLSVLNTAESSPQKDVTQVLTNQKELGTMVLPPLKENDSISDATAPEPSVGTVKNTVPQNISQKNENTICFDGTERVQEKPKEKVPLDQTIVISDDDLLTVAKNKDVSPKNEFLSSISQKNGGGRTRLILGLVLLLSVGFLFLPGKKSAGDSSSKAREHSGSYFICQLPSKWRVAAKGEAIVLSADRDLNSGVALLKIESSDVKRWTFETHAVELIEKTMTELSDSQAPDVSLVKSGDNERPSTVLCQQSLQSVPFPIRTHSLTPDLS